jgi:hypothetical protein
MSEGGDVTQELLAEVRRLNERAWDWHRHWTAAAERADAVEARRLELERALREAAGGLDSAANQFYALIPEGENWRIMERKAAAARSVLGSSEPGSEETQVQAVRRPSQVTFNSADEVFKRPPRASGQAREGDDDWQFTTERVDPHGLCCPSCRAAREASAQEERKG